MKTKQFCQTFISLVVCCLFLAFMGRTAAADSLKTIDVPAYYWNHGCSPTSGGMLFGYYDTNGYYNLFPGDASTQTTEVYNLIASPEHVRDYWGNPDPNPGGHEDNCIADFMGTSRDGLGNGATWISNIDDGLEDYASYRGYAATSWHEYWGSFTWDDLVAEIDNDRPMLFHVDSNSDGGLDHSITTMGYKEEGGEKYYAARNTWNYSLHWYEFKPISSGQPFGVGWVTLLHFTTPAYTNWIAGTADWHTASNWEPDLPTAIKDAHIDNGGTALITLSAQVNKLYIGYNATGAAQQSSGACTIASALYLGHGSGSSGTYTLDGGDLTASDEYIGMEGTGTFSQSGGTNAVKNLHINASSSYTFSGGMLSIKEDGEVHGAIDFADGNATLNVEGGIADLRDTAFTNTGSATFASASDSLTIFSPGFNPVTGFASYEANGATYTPGAKMIVYAGQSFTGHYDFDDPLEIRGTLTASGGTFGFRDSLTVSNGGFFDASAETFQLQDGQTATIAEGGVLSASDVIVASSGVCVFNQEGGTHVIDGSLYIARSVFDDRGTYNLNGGELSANDVVVGYGFGTGQFYQTGGTHNIAGGLSIGAHIIAKSAYVLSGGTLEVPDLTVLDYGRFSIMNGEARLTISGAMTLEKLAEYTAAPGAAIHMTGAIFDNKSDSAVNLNGLENTCFIFEGGDDITDTFEIAGYDYGLAEEYFCMNNFLLDGLVLGGDDVARLRLMDNHANYTGSSVKTCPEALYVRGLTINKGSTLDLNGYHLYAMEYINLGGAVLNGEVIAMSETVIPEPTALLLLVPGILGITIRVKRRRRKDWNH